MVFCTNCGTRNEGGARFCTNCGTPALSAGVEIEQDTAVNNIQAQPEVLPESGVSSNQNILMADEKYCFSCGLPIKKAAKICPKCGVNQGTRSSTAAIDVYCTSCGQSIKKEVTICPFCGISIKNKSVGSAIFSRFKSRKYGNEQLRRKLKKIGLIAAAALGIIGMAIMGVIIYTINDKNHTLQSNYTNLQSNYDTLYRNYNDNSNWLRKLQNAYASIIVTGLRVGNMDSKGATLTNPGGRLNASQVRYLYPVITYDSLEGQYITFYVKIINPNGILNTGTSSPRGYSYIDSRQVTRGNGLSLGLKGWGNDYAYTYQAGQYTVEVWYNNICLKSEKITIY